ncbi:hypothetical protein QVD17_06800 [Tagetes erecta]|uniref:Protein kinase domain-containing protein n=1 Tax=Tagetes erecta TaxID=13708 RepID=A0AAD8LP50_TARER|nr:hypothetical protein QVD17_06800 [Tagetes erecta]
MIDNRMGGLSCFCFPGRRKVSPDNNGVSDQQQAPDDPTGLLTIYIYMYIDGTRMVIKILGLEVAWKHVSMNLLLVSQFEVQRPMIDALRGAKTGIKTPLLFFVSIGALPLLRMQRRLTITLLTGQVDLTSKDKDQNSVVAFMHPMETMIEYSKVQKVDNEDSQMKSNGQLSRTQQAQSSPSSLQIDVPANTKTNKQREFSYQELVNATGNFKIDRYLGEGGFGVVYKGKLDNPNQVVAVKKLNPDGLQGHKEFIVEITMLSLVCHPNIVNLIGYCSENNKRILVYEFMPLGSLEDHLHDPKPYMKPLDWNTRINIALGTARGLNHLHHNCEPPIIYRDMKSANILLGEGYHPKISDLGLAKFGPLGDKSYVSTRVMGTMGYCAPEYGFTGHLTIKSDTYSFGVVLLELVTGRQALDKTREGGQYLIEWAEPMLVNKRRYVKLADPRMQGKFMHRPLKKTVEVALMCMNDDLEKRPDMSEVVDTLDRVASLSNPHTCSNPNQDSDSDSDSDSLFIDDEEERAKAIAEAKMWGEKYRHEAATTASTRPL